MKGQKFEKKLINFEFFDETRNVDLIFSDVLSSSVSIHTPLHQFLASLAVGFNQNDQATRKWRSRSKTFKS
jgi:hypothetical protein